MVLNVTFQDRLFIPSDHFRPCGRKFISKGTERDIDTGEFLNTCVWETKNYCLNNDCSYVS